MQEAKGSKRAARPAQRASNPAANHPAYVREAHEQEPAAPVPESSARGAARDAAKSRSGSQRRKKLHMVTTAYDTIELAALDEAASRAGLTRASYQRVQTLATPPKTRSTRRAPVDRELLAKALGQLGRVGNNLNQVAKAARMGRTEHVEIMTALADLRDLLPLFMDALGRKI